jgi:hypothetical protein
VLEPPIVPDIAVLVHPPRRRAWDVIAKLHDEWIGQHKREEKVEHENEEVRRET